jgi:hypothetical protein
LRIADCGLKAPRQWVFGAREKSTERGIHSALSEMKASRGINSALQIKTLPASVPNEPGSAHFDSVVADISGDAVAGDNLFVWCVCGVPVSADLLTVCH